MAGHLGQALTFNGSTSYVDVGDVLNFSTLPITVSTWIKIAQNAGNFPAIVTTDAHQAASDAHSGAYLVLNADGTISINYGDNTACGSTGRRTKNGSTALSIGQWYHVVGVIRGATDMSIYINGNDDGGT